MATPLIRALLTLGTMMMTQVGVNTSQSLLFVNVALIGIGMGLCVPTFFIAVQTSVPRQMLGAATSGLQFSRSIGGTIGVGVMGLILALRLSDLLTQVGVDPKTVSLSALLDSSQSASVLAALAPLRGSLATAMQAVFITSLIAAIGALIVTTLAPRGRIGATSHELAEGAGVPAGE